MKPKANDMCPCGSGKKYKECCGAEEVKKSCACGSGKPYGECCGA